MFSSTKKKTETMEIYERLEKKNGHLVMGNVFKKEKKKKQKKMSFIE